MCCVFWWLELQRKKAMHMDILSVVSDEGSGVDCGGTDGVDFLFAVHYGPPVRQSHVGDG